MSKIYDALKKLEAERLGGTEANGHGAEGDGHANGHANGNGNGNGDGNGARSPQGWRRGLDWLRTAAVGGDDAKRGSGTLTVSADVEDQYQRLGTNLLSGPGAEAGSAMRLLGVAASRPGEGATTTTAMFGSILARRRQGRVAVVEANLRTPAFASVFGVPSTPGLVDLVMGHATLADVARPSQIPNLFVIPAGESSMAPPALFDAAGVGALLDQLRAAFEFVIVDLPPVNVYGDASILGPRLDGALLVIEADRTRVPEVERARRTLERSGVRVVGSVLNRRRNYIPAFIEEML